MPDHDTENIKLALHLSSGAVIETYIDIDALLDQDEVNAHIQHLLADQDAVRYRLKLGDVVFERDAVIAIQTL